MNVVFAARHYELADEVREHITGRLTKLAHILDDVSNPRVVLTSEHAHRNVAEVSCSVRGHNFVATAEAEDMTVAADRAAARIETQLRRFKDRRVGRRRQAKSTAEAAVALPVVTRDDQVSAGTTMTVEQAVEELDASELEYVAFTNAETEQVTVLYRRGDGTVGMIEPS